MTLMIVVPNVNIDLLRKQRDWLIEHVDDIPQQNQLEEGQGIINLLDAMLDIAEGYE